MRRHIALLALSFGLSGCWTSAPPLNAPATFTATIGTTPFVGDSAKVGGYFAGFNPGAGLLIVGGSDSTSAGMYTLEVVAPATRPAVGTLFIQCGSPSYVYTPTATYSTDCYANGQLEVTSIDTVNHRIAGRFAFRARLGVTDSLIQVSNGRFSSSY